MSFLSWLRGLFGKPSQSDPNKFGIVRVYFGEPRVEWDSQKLAWFETQLKTMAALGPSFIRVLLPRNADVTVLHWDSEANGNKLGAGQYTASKRLIEIDPVGCQGELELRACLGHELGHYLGMQHIPRSRGVAMMNPCLNYDRDVEIGFDTVAFRVACVDPTALDIAEFNRARR